MGTYKKPKGHSENIKCPECNCVQNAFVEYTNFWNSYVHTCENCLYIICESEWNRIN